MAMTAEIFTPSPDDPHVLSFCSTICPGVDPVYVDVRPEKWAVMLHCFPNVERKVHESGGSMVYGWEIYQDPKIHLEAQFHAVWQTPAGNYLDITPEELGQARILFLREDTRTYTGAKVPHLRFSLGDRALVERYWHLIDQSLEILTQLKSQGFPLDHPVYRERLGGLAEETQELKARLLAA